VKEYYCRYCGKESTYTDVDYLIGNDHLSCVLNAMDEAKKPKVMKIKGWEKISGYVYKGYALVNPIHNAGETKYMVDVLDLNLPHKPKWELSVLTSEHKWLGSKSDNFGILLWDDNRMNVTRSVNKEDMQSLAKFNRVFEEMIDEMLGIRLASAPAYSSHSMGGIVNNVTNSGTTIPYAQMIQTQQSLSAQIKQLTKKINGGSK